MTVFELGAIGEFAGAILLFLSLIYVGVQLQQGRKLTRIDGIEKRLDRWSAFSRLTMQDAGLRQIWRKGNENLEKLDAEEKYLYDALVLEGWLIISRQQFRSKELKDADELIQATKNAQIFLRRSGEWWKKNREALASPFREWVDSVLTEMEKEN
jgi:hypothetical protein